MFERLLTSFQNIFKIPELRTRILFTMGMLVVYRIGAHIPTPGINGEALSEFLQKQGGALLGFLDIFSGGSLSRLTILALGIMPYISASIILQLMGTVIPALQKIQQEGDSKVRAALEKQGFAVEKYNKIFAAVNGDGELRKKTLKLIEQERKKT